jgi:peptide/nickel transport system substrate-binding protein
MHPAASASPDAPSDGPRRPFGTLAAVTAAAVALRFVLCVCVGLVAAVAWTAPATAAHGIAMHGEPALAADFAHLPYADPDAPQGGTVTYGILGSFDSLNPFIPRGNIAAGLRDPLYGNLVFESLLDRNRDEPFSLYGLLARDVEVAEDRSSVTFRMNPNARFSDGAPVTVDDVVFSLEILRTRGRPNYRAYYSKVTEIERIGEDGVRFVFADGSDRELPLILGLMPVLPKHAIDPEMFERT